jgi:hypothetical protein
MALRAPERIEAPAVTPALGGLLNVASIVEAGDRVMNGVVYQSFLCGRAGIAPGLCDPASGVIVDDEKVFTGGEVVTGEPFPVYAGVVCDLLGGDYEAQARARLLGGEERAVGRAFYEIVFSGGYPTGDQFAGTITPEDELLAAIGELEQYAGENYAGLPVLHMNRAMAARALKWDLIDNDSIDGTLHTKQGTPVANSPGYPDGIIFITGAVHLWRTSVQAYNVNDVMDNEALSLAERVYTAATDCILAWAGVEPPEYTAPVLTSLAPTSIVVGTAPTSVVATGTGFVSSTRFYVGATRVAAVIDSATKATLSIPGQASPGTVQVTAVNGTESSDAVDLTVNPAAPTLTSVAPNPGPQGKSYTYTLTGTNFTPASVVTANGQTPAVTYVSPTQLKVTITANSDQDFSVTTAGGTTATKTNPVRRPPSFTSAAPNPANVPANTATNVQIVGSGLGQDIILKETNQDGSQVLGDLTMVSMTGSNVIVTIPARAAGTTVYLRPFSTVLPADVATDYAIAPKAVPVVAAVAPVATSIAPSLKATGVAASTVITGTGINGNTIVAELNGTTALFPITARTATTATFSVPASQAAGQIFMKLYDPPNALASGPVGFNTRPVPTVTSLSPTSVVQGTTGLVTVTGTNFLTAATATGVSNRVLVDGTVVGTSQISPDGTTLTFNPSTLAAGTHEVKVQLISGTSTLVSTTSQTLTVT